MLRHEWGTERATRQRTEHQPCWKNSSGENPRERANSTAVAIKTPVIRRFGQALSAHCPPHVSCACFEDGKRYGIGHCSPSGPRAPIRSAYKQMKAEQNQKYDFSFLLGKYRRERCDKERES
jgi:hypothetical protein